jgi:hypothetical protein
MARRPSTRRAIEQPRGFPAESDPSTGNPQKVGLLDRYWDGSALVAEHAGRLDAIDLGGCPRDFQGAYKRYVSAWTALARVKASNEGLNGALKGYFSAGLAVLPAMQEVERALKDVDDSSSELRQVAIGHGIIQ